MYPFLINFIGRLHQILKESFSDSLCPSSPVVQNLYQVNRMVLLNFVFLFIEISIVVTVCISSRGSILE